MILDWLSREGWLLVNWWVVVTIAGLSVLPLLVRMLHGLPDRGYTLARPAGMLLIAFVFWLLAVLGFINNTVGSIILAWLIVLLISIAAYFYVGSPFNWREWWQDNRWAIIVFEILFMVLFVGWAVYRAHQNEIQTTEKPMDLAFMSSIQRGLDFPPNDPWLAGYAISYYYLGYVMAAMMAMINNVQSTIGYNLHIALLFALAGTAAFGLVYNLVRSRAFDRRWIDVERKRSPSQPTAITFGLLATVMMVLMGNYELALVELPYNTYNASEEYLEFWKANLRDEPRAEGRSADVAGWDYWWWFRSARSIRDKDIGGGHEEVIAEFPNFSFLLADSHPHVMALPIVLLSMGLALNVLLAAQRPDWLRTLFYGICVGSLVFLNTWDAPIYIMALVGADALRRYMQRGRWLADDWAEMVAFGGALVVIMVVAYSPFLIGFRSQLAGVLPNIINPTYFPQLFLMFGPFFFLISAYIGVEVWRGVWLRRFNAHLMLITGGVLLFVLVFWAFMILLVGSLLIPSVPLNFLGYWVGEEWIVPTVGEVAEIALTRKAAAILTPLVLIVGLTLVVGRLFPTDDPERLGERAYAPATGYTLMLLGIGLSLVFIPEFVYLRDNFGSRMNTVFKFYYQVWAVFTIATAYGAYTIVDDVEAPKPWGVLRYGFVAGLPIIIGLGLLYPVLGVYTRGFVETGRVSGGGGDLTLDGGLDFVGQDDYNVIMCLRDIVGRDDVVVAEAEKVTYREYYGRVGSLTGIPVLANWLGHQRQWRGTGYDEAAGSRRKDLITLYRDQQLDIIQDVINRYNIDYILYGATERRDFGADAEIKFLDNFPVVCESGNSRVYSTVLSLSAIAG